jgi:hypothetical protein
MSIEKKRNYYGIRKARLSENTFLIKHNESTLPTTNRIQDQFSMPIALFVEINFIYLQGKNQPLRAPVIGRRN